MEYILLKAQERPVAGLMALPPDAGDAQPGWMGDIYVDDVDKTASQVKELVVRSSMDQPTSRKSGVSPPWPIRMAQWSCC